MINQKLPQVKTVKLLFVAMEEQQQAMFKMAFKMHNTINYQFWIRHRVKHRDWLLWMVLALAG